MLAHAANFLKLIDSVFEDISHGVDSRHHFHNVRCGIENILVLLEYNNEVDEKADQLSHRARDYITYRDRVASKISDEATGEDIDRLCIARAALDRFRCAVEHSKPNSRVRTLGLA